MKVRKKFWLLPIVLILFLLGMLFIFTRMEPLVLALQKALLPDLDVPFAFFGHSMGALVSFELARHLRRTSRLGPVHLFVSGRCAPQLPASHPPRHALPESEFLKELRALNGTPNEALEHEALMQVVLPTLRADFAVIETNVYTSEPPLDCPISAFGGLQDGEVTRDCLLAWCQQTTASFSLRLFPGDHFFIHTARPLLLNALSRELLQHLSTVTGRSSS